MRVLLLFLSFFCSVKAMSQDGGKAAMMTTQNGGRYEILQSQISSIYTFKLDKHEGKVFIFVKIPGEPRPNWLQLPKGVTPSDTVVPGQINYQLFSGGDDSPDCLLLNIHSGATWILQKNKSGTFSFEPFETLF